MQCNCPDKVKLRGAQVGKVASIEALPDGHAAIDLAMDPSQLQFIPSNMMVNAASANGIRFQVRGIDGVSQSSSQPQRAEQTLYARPM